MRQGARRSMAHRLKGWPGLAQVLLPLGILLLAAALRFHRLGEQSLWYDEGVAYAHSLRSLPELIPLLQNNVHLPAYFALLGWWQDVAGDSEFALRALSAFFSIVSVAWVYALGKNLARPGAGLAAASFAALNSFSIFYAQEARMYAMLAAIAGGSMWLFLRLMSREPGAGRHQKTVIALGMVNALGMYTHVAFALVLVAQALSALVMLGGQWRSGGGRGFGRKLRDSALAILLTLLLFLPWAPISLRQILAQPNLSQPATLGDLLPWLGSSLVFGITSGQTPPGLLVAIVCLACLCLYPFRGRGMSWLWLMPALWTLISLALYVWLGLTTRYLRFLLPAQLASALWLGLAVWRLWSLAWAQSHAWLRSLPKLAGLIAMGAMLLTLADGLDALYNDREFQRDDMRGLAARIEADLREDDGLLVSAPGLVEVLGYYYAGTAPMYALPTTSDAELTRAQTRKIIAAHDRLHVILYGAAEQDPQLIVETTLNTSAFEISDVWVDDLRYLRYARPAPLTLVKELDLPFGDAIKLRSYALSDAELATGDVLQAQFIWSAIAKPGKRYKVFLQLLNAAGELTAQRDSQPQAGSAPTTDWQAGDFFIDNHALLIPPGLSAGSYRLIAGLYDADDASARLPVAGESYVELARVKVIAG